MFRSEQPFFFKKVKKNWAQISTAYFYHFIRSFLLSTYKPILLQKISTELDAIRNYYSIFHLNGQTLNFIHRLELKRKNLVQYNKQHHKKVLLNILFQWSHLRISFAVSKVRTTLYSIINSTTGKYCSVAFI